MRKTIVLIVLMLSLMVINFSEAASLPAAYVVPLSAAIVDSDGTLNPYCTVGEDCILAFCYEIRGRGTNTVSITVAVIPQGQNTAIFQDSLDVDVTLVPKAAPVLTCDTLTVSGTIMSLVPPNLYTLKVIVDDSSLVNKSLATKVRVTTP